MKNFQYPYELFNDDFVVVRCENGKFMVARWDNFNNNWIRENSEKGSAFHTDIDVIANDDIGGGAIEHTLRVARNLARNGSDCQEPEATELFND